MFRLLFSFFLTIYFSNPPANATNTNKANSALVNNHTKITNTSNNITNDVLPQYTLRRRNNNNTTTEDIQLTRIDARKANSMENLLKLVELSDIHREAASSPVPPPVSKSERLTKSGGERNKLTASKKASTENLFNKLVEESVQVQTMRRSGEKYEHVAESDEVNTGEGEPTPRIAAMAATREVEEDGNDEVTIEGEEDNEYSRDNFENDDDGNEEEIQEEIQEDLTEEGNADGSEEEDEGDEYGYEVTEDLSNHNDTEKEDFRVQTADGERGEEEEEEEGNRLVYDASVNGYYDTKTRKYVLSNK